LTSTAQLTTIGFLTEIDKDCENYRHTKIRKTTAGSSKEINIVPIPICFTFATSVICSK